MREPKTNLHGSESLRSVRLESLGAVNELVLEETTQERDLRDDLAPLHPLRRRCSAGLDPRVQRSGEKSLRNEEVDDLVLLVSIVRGEESSDEPDFGRRKAGSDREGRT